MQKNSEVQNSYQINDRLFDKLLSDTVNAAARKMGLASVLRKEWGSTSLVSYKSAGKLLIIGSISKDMDQDRVIQIANDLAEIGFNTTVLISNNNPDAVASQTIQQLSKGNISVIVDELNELNGFLGQFSVQFGLVGKDNFDLILDLGLPAYLQQEVLPPGYFTPGDEPEKLRTTLQQISQMIGDFGKPVYVKYQKDICAHSKAGITGCTRCLDCCPAEAIQDKENNIEVNTSLCLGCGSCTVACPTGALSYTYPAVHEWLIMVRELLADYGNAGGKQPTLLIYDDKGESALFDHAAVLPDNMIPLPVNEIGSLGMDSWFATLAYGADCVVLLIGNDTPESITAGIKKQLSVAHSILNGMGYSEDRLSLIELNENNTFTIGNEEGKSFQNNPAASFMPFEKYRTIRFALNHLYKHAPKPQELVILPEGSTFGEVQVDPDTCTLCMSCVMLCPAQALQHDAERLKLSFIESNCIQCGLCRNGCPENSITLSPRYLYDDARASQPRLLNEDTPLCCIACGKPFISKRMFDSINKKLATNSNWNVSEEVTPDWLKMCGDCRIK